MNGETTVPDARELEISTMLLDGKFTYEQARAAFAMHRIAKAEAAVVGKPFSRKARGWLYQALGFAVFGAVYVWFGASVAAPEWLSTILGLLALGPATCCGLSIVMWLRVVRFGSSVLD